MALDTQWIHPLTLYFDRVAGILATGRVSLRRGSKGGYRISTEHYHLFITNLTKLQNSPFYWGVKLWEEIPEEIKKCTQKLEF